MQIIHTDHPYRVDYPVGDYIVEWIKIANMYSQYIQKFNRKNLPLQLFCRGSSGAMLAALVSTCTEVKQIIHIKKDGEYSHNFSVPRIDSERRFNVIVDDFISSGETVCSILGAYPNIKFDLCTVACGDLEPEPPNLKILVTR